MYEFYLKSVLNVYSADLLRLEIDLGFNTFVSKDIAVWGIKAPLPVEESKTEFDEAKKYAIWWLKRYQNSDLRIRTRKVAGEKNIIGDIFYLQNGFETRLSDVMVDKGLVTPLRERGFYTSAHKESQE